MKRADPIQTLQAIVLKQLDMMNAHRREIQKLARRLDRFEAKEAGPKPKSLLLAKPIHDVARTVAERHGMTLADIIRHQRTSDIAAVRQEAMLACRRAGFTDGAIGRALERDHATVAHNIRAALAREGKA